VAVEQVVNQGNATVNAVKFVETYGEVYVNNVAKLAREWLPASMSTSRVSFAEPGIRILLEEGVEK
jgi:hypothetical protein